jgi:hypothetical protein
MTVGTGARLTNTQQTRTLHATGTVLLVLAYTIQYYWH